jgi:hypothetical protein
MADIAGGLRVWRRLAALLALAALGAIACAPPETRAATPPTRTHSPAASTTPVGVKTAGADTAKSARTGVAAHLNGTAPGSDPAEIYIMYATLAAAAFSAVQALALFITFWIMRQTGQYQLRAYLVVDTCEITILRAGVPVEASVRIVNVGQTPAIDVHYQTGVSILDYPTNALPTRPSRQDVNNSVHRFFISKASEIVKQSSQNLSSEDIRTIGEGMARRIYVHGSIFYRDVFKHEHSTRFCLTTHGTHAPFTVEFFRSGNEID